MDDHTASWKHTLRLSCGFEAAPTCVRTALMPSTVGKAEPNTFWPGTPLKLGAPGMMLGSLADWQPGKWSSFKIVCAPSTSPVRLAIKPAASSVAFSSASAGRDWQMLGHCNWLLQNLCTHIFSLDSVSASVAPSGATCKYGCI